MERTQEKKECIDGTAYRDSFQDWSEGIKALRGADVRPAGTDIPDW